MQNYIHVPIIGYGFTPNGATESANHGTAQLGETIIYAMTIPSDNLGGGITVTEFKPYCNGTIAANIMDISLVTLGTTGSVVGTVAHCGSAVFGFGGIKNYYNVVGTVVAADAKATGYWCDNDAGDYALAVQVKQVAVLAIGTATLGFSIGYQQGR
jgi:hypothetical protein